MAVLKRAFAAENIPADILFDLVQSGLAMARVKRVDDRERSPRGDRVVDHGGGRVGAGSAVVERNKPPVVRYCAASAIFAQCSRNVERPAAFDPRISSGTDHALRASDRMSQHKRAHAAPATRCSAGLSARRSRSNDGVTGFSHSMTALKLSRTSLLCRG